MRLNRYLASAGLGSRRGVEELIRSGRVRINGQPVTDLATDVTPGDSVKVGSRVVHAEERRLYAVLNKPRGYVCTASDERGRRTIFELLPREWPRVFHVGRLDSDSEGLLLITNDGALALEQSHPRYKVEKEYEVLLDRPLDPAHREKLLRGFRIEPGRGKFERVEIVAPQHLRVTLLQGLKRQIRLMLYELGYEVKALRRIRIGPIWSRDLPVGCWRLLSGKEIAALRRRDAAPEKPRAVRPPRGDKTRNKNRGLRESRG